MFQLYRGYANSDRAQVAGTTSRLAKDLALNSVSAVVAPSGGGVGWAYQESSQGNAPIKHSELPIKIIVFIALKYRQ